jgi:hypothetical protein
MKLKFVFYILLLLQLSVFAQSQSESQKKSAVIAAKADSVLVDKSKDSSTVSKLIDTTTKVDVTDSNSTPNAIVSGDSAKVKPEIKLSKKRYNHREQVVFAAGMMAFIAVILGTVQNWNPD